MNYRNIKNVKLSDLRISFDLFSVRWIASERFACAIAVSKREGNAVARNKIKRRIRALLHKHSANLPNIMCIISCKKDCGVCDFIELEHELLRVFGEIKLMCDKHVVHCEDE